MKKTGVRLLGRFTFFLILSFLGSNFSVYAQTTPNQNTNLTKDRQSVILIPKNSAAQKPSTLAARPQAKPPIPSPAKPPIKPGKNVQPVAFPPAPPVNPIAPANPTPEYTYFMNQIVNNVDSHGIHNSVKVNMPSAAQYYLRERVNNEFINNRINWLIYEYEGFTAGNHTILIYASGTRTSDGSIFHQPIGRLYVNGLTGSTRVEDFEPTPIFLNGTDTRYILAKEVGLNSAGVPYLNFVPDPFIYY